MIELKEYNGKYVLLLAESSLERIPEGFLKYKKTRILAKRMNIEPQYIILDKSLFFEEMKKEKIDDKRGRPDIIYMFVMATQYSILNQLGKLRILIHTLNNELIEFKQDVRPPKNYYQFINLMQQLFKYKKVPPSSKTPLITLKDKVPLIDLINVLNRKNIVLLHERGSPATCEKIGAFPPQDTLFVIGGFPHGDFSVKIKNIATHVFSIYEGKPLDAWIVADRITCCLEQKTGIL